MYVEQQICTTAVLCTRLTRTPLARNHTQADCSPRAFIPSACTQATFIMTHLQIVLQQEVTPLASLAELLANSQYEDNKQPQLHRQLCSSSEAGC